MTGVIQELRNPSGQQIHEVQITLWRECQNISAKTAISLGGKCWRSWGSTEHIECLLYGRSSSGHWDSGQTTESLLSWILHSLVPTTKPSNKSASTYVTDTVLIIGEILVVTRDPWDTLKSCDDNFISLFSERGGNSKLWPLNQACSTKICMFSP